MVAPLTRVLVAEDESAVAKPLVAHLESNGFEVHWVTTVQEVRGELETTTPDVLVLDNTLDTDGLEYLQAIRFAPHHPRAGVVVMSDSVTARERGLQLGAMAAIPKPVDCDVLTATLRELLGAN